MCCKISSLWGNKERSEGAAGVASCLRNKSKNSEANALISPPAFSLMGSCHLVGSFKKT